MINKIINSRPYNKEFNMELCDTTKKSKLYKFMMFIFIISLGFGEIVTVAGVKLSYITSILLFIIYIIENKKIKNKKYNNLIIFCFVWICYATLQILYAKNIDLWWTFYRTLIINMFIIFMILCYIKTLEDWIFLNKAFIISIFISLIVGIWEIYTGEHLVDLIGYNNLIYYDHKPISFYGNENDFATVLIYGIYSILLNIYFSRKRKLNISINIIILIGIIYELIIINSRGALYSAILMLVLIPLCICLSKLSKKSNMKFKLILFILFSSLILILSFIFSNYSINQVVYWISSLSSISGNYKSDIWRAEITINGLKSLLSTLGFGTGCGQSILISGINLHNFYLEILVEYGIFVGGYIILSIFRLLTNTRNKIPIWPDSVIKSFPIIMILLGISSSGAVRIRSTWIIIALLYTLKYFKQNSELENQH